MIESDEAYPDRRGRAGGDVLDEPMRHPTVRAGLAWRILTDRRALHVPPGHPYSPIPSTEDVARAVRRFEAAGRSLPDVDLREGEQLALLHRLLPLYDEYPFTDSGPDRFRLDNDYFTGSDAVGAYLMLRDLRPRRVVEVGCGWSTALLLDIDEMFLGSATRFAFVEPDPRRLRSVVAEDVLHGRLRESVAQDVPLELFTGLDDGDVLMIDSSHVLKAGSDVQHLMDEVLPRLRPGVHVHVHDVFFPFEYPPSWLRTGCSLNEAYAVRGLVRGGAFDVVLFNTYLERFHRPWFEQHMPKVLAGRFLTGGIWLRRS